MTLIIPENSLVFTEPYGVVVMNRFFRKEEFLVRVLDLKHKAYTFMSVDNIYISPGLPNNSTLAMDGLPVEKVLLTTSFNLEVSKHMMQVLQEGILPCINSGRYRGTTTAFNIFLTGTEFIKLEPIFKKYEIMYHYPDEKGYYLVEFRHHHISLLSQCVYYTLTGSRKDSLNRLILKNPGDHLLILSILAETLGISGQGLVSYLQQDGNYIAEAIQSPTARGSACLLKTESIRVKGVLPATQGHLVNVPFLQQLDPLGRGYNLKWAKGTIN